MNQETANVLLAKLRQMLNTEDYVYIVNFIDSLVSEDEPKKQEAGTGPLCCDDAMYYVGRLQISHDESLPIYQCNNCKRSTTNKLVA